MRRVRPQPVTEISHTHTSHTHLLHEEKGLAIFHIFSRARQDIHILLNPSAAQLQQLEAARHVAITTILGEGRKKGTVENEKRI